MKCAMLYEGGMNEIVMSANGVLINAVNSRRKQIFINNGYNEARRAWLFISVSQL